MSKKIRPRAAAFLAALSIMALLLTGARTGAQQQGVAVAPNTRSSAVVAATAEVLQETSQIRGLAVLRPVKSGAQSRADIERMIVKNINEDTTPEEMRSSEVALKKLGLVPASFEFRPFIIKLLTEQVAGYYDPKAQEFYLADWIDLDGQKPVMAHELTHALQDQHFNLRRFEKWPKGDSDAELAAHALIEGDATLAMIRYISRDLSRAVAFAKSIGTGGGSDEQIKNAPRALRDTLLFPYEQGLEFASKIYQRDGWPGVSLAFKNLPQSTEQILHADKYFAREAPLKVELPDIRAMLGPNWKRIDYDVNGEWSLYLILDEYLQAKDESKRAAAGWGGDRYSTYEESKTGQVFIVQRSEWDSQTDAREFYDAYKERTVQRYKDTTRLISLAFSSPDTESESLHTSEGLVIIYRSGQTVLVLEGLPEKVDVKALMEALGVVKGRERRAG
jgi:hypothetical protein